MKFNHRLTRPGSLYARVLQMETEITEPTEIEELVDEPATPGRPPTHDYETIDAAIQSNWKLKGRDRQNWQVIAQVLGVKKNVIYGRIAWLRKRGMGPKVARNNTADRNKTRDMTASFNSEEMLKRIASGEIPDEKERRQILSVIAASSTDQNRVTAIKALQDIDNAKNKGIGPPPPMDDEERVTRAAKVLRAIGEKLSKRAMEAAFEQKTVVEEEIALPEGTVSDGNGDLAGDLAGREDGPGPDGGL